MRKLIWIVLTLIVIAAIFTLYPTIKKQLALSEIEEIHSEGDAIATSSSEDTVEAVTEPSTTINEDPIKQYITEKIKKVEQGFFNYDVKIVAIGDSLTQGVGDETGDNGYVSILENTINREKQLIDIANFGKRGNRTDQLIKRMKQPEIKEALNSADIVIITIGANDIMQIFKENFTDLTLNKFETGRVTYEKRLNQILTTIEENNKQTEIYLVGLYNPFKKYFKDIEELETIVNSWNEVSKEVSLNHQQVTYIPIKDLFENTAVNVFSSDNFHPNYHGYQLMAERVFDYIVKEEKVNGNKDTER